MQDKEINAMPIACDRIRARHKVHRQEVVDGLLDLIEQIEDNDSSEAFTINPFVAYLRNAILLIDSID